MRNLAPQYWSKSDTADCTLVIPVPHPKGVASAQTPDAPFQTASKLHDPFNRGRRATEPVLPTFSRITLELHIDYLSAHSSFLRGLFSGASPLDLITASSTTDPQAQGLPNVPSSRRPRLLPSSPTHPIILLPVPDPSSLPLLIHWIYFGQTNYIEDALIQGSIQWEGIARNVEYLGMDKEIRLFLGRWYRLWLNPHSTEQVSPPRDECAEDSGYEDDVDISSDSDSCDGADYDSAADDDDDYDENEDDDMMMFPDDDVEPPRRGRTPTVRPLQDALASVVRRCST